MTSVLQLAAELVNNVLRQPDVPGPAHVARLRAQKFGSVIVPKVQSAQHDIGVFASAASSTIDGLLRQLSAGTPPANLVASVHSLGKDCAAKRSVLAPISEELGQERNGFAQDIAALYLQQNQLSSEKAGLAAKREGWADESSQLHTRATIVDIIGSIFPPVKLGDEIAGLIQYHKTTEEELADLDRNLAEVNSNIQSLGLLISGIIGLGHAVNQIVSTVQNLENAVSLASSQLSDDSHFGSAATPATTALFLNALKSSIGTLAADSRD